MRRLRDEVSLRVEGHLKIFEYASHEDLAANNPTRILLNKRNAIHEENASILIARAIGNRSDGSIYSMYFGTGGATVDALGNIIFATPNTIGAADLNDPVYFEVVDDLEGAPAGNSMAVRHVNGTVFSDVEIRCVIDKNDPFGQQAFDNIATNVNSTPFSFSEIGLKTQDNLLVTHVVFAPIQKSANRIIEVIYVLRVRLT